MAHYINRDGQSACTLPPTHLGYIEAHNDALHRLRAGQRQQRCARCLCYRWPDERQACEDFTADGPIDDSPEAEATIAALLDDDRAWWKDYHALTGE